MFRRICFRADASSDIGYGHFIRTLALADMLKEDFDCTYFTVDPTFYQKEELSKVCKYIALNPFTHFTDFLSVLTGNEIVVLDNYFFSTDYQKQIKSKGCCLVCIDDMHDKHYVADILINYALTDFSSFSKESNTKLCLGLEWALLRKDFYKVGVSKKEKTSSLQKATICMGGVDKYHLAETIIDFLLPVTGLKHVDIVSGDKSDFNLSVHPPFSLNIHKNLSANEIISLFCSNDFAIVSTSTICVEALACSVPLLGGYYVDNQEEFYQVLCENNYIFGLGALRNISSIDLDSFANYIPQFPKFQEVIPRYRKLFNSL